MSNNTLTILSLFIVLFSTSCATIVSKSTYPVSINSEPSGADVTIANSDGHTVYTGRTPAFIQLESSKGYFQREEYLITFQKEGYETTLQPITTRIDGWYWGNLVFGGVLGLLVVDPITGSMFKLDREIYHATLFELDGRTGNIPPNQIPVIKMEDIPRSWMCDLKPLD